MKMRSKKSTHNQAYHSLAKTKGRVDEKELKKRLTLRIIKEIVNSEELTEAQRQVLGDYFKFLMAGGSRVRSMHTFMSIFRNLYKFAEHFKKPFNKVTREDLITYSSYLFEKGMKQSSINLRMAIIKKFYNWLGLPHIVSWLKIKSMKTRLQESELLTAEDLKKMVSKCDNPRDKALLMVLFEGALRIDEALTLKIKHVVVDDYGIKLNVTGKTGKRPVRLIDSVPYLQSYLNNHSFADDPESPLFISVRKQYGRQLKYAGARDVLLKAKKLAEINKNMTLHLLRHSRLDQLGKEGFRERDLRIFAGWAEKSDMPSVYLHYGEEEVDKKLLRRRGILKDEKKQLKGKEVLKSKECPRCKKVNEATALYCNCGMALDLKTVMKDKQRVDTEIGKTIEFIIEMARNPELMKKFEEFKTRNTL